LDFVGGFGFLTCHHTSLSLSRACQSTDRLAVRLTYSVACPCDVKVASHRNLDDLQYLSFSLATLIISPPPTLSHASYGPKMDCRRPLTRSTFEFFRSRRMSVIRRSFRLALPCMHACILALPSLSIFFWLSACLAVWLSASQAA
jgi:hypothetical protein